MTDMWERWGGMTNRLRQLARDAGCIAVNELDLIPGDRFRLFENPMLDHGCVALVVYVWDSADDGFGHGHEEVSGREALFTGEDWVAYVREKR